MSYVLFALLMFYGNSATSSKKPNESRSNAPKMILHVCELKIVERMELPRWVPTKCAPFCSSSVRFAFYDIEWRWCNCSENKTDEKQFNVWSTYITCELLEFLKYRPRCIAEMFDNATVIWCIRANSKKFQTIYIRHRWNFRALFLLCLFAWFLFWDTHTFHVYI